MISIMTLVELVRQAEGWRVRWLEREPPLVNAFLMFLGWLGIRDDSSPGLAVSHAIFQNQRPQRDTGIEISVETEISHRTRVHAPFIFFEFVNQLHRSDFGRAAHRTCGEGGAHNVVCGLVRV